MNIIKTDYSAGISYLRQTAGSAVAKRSPARREVELFRYILQNLPIGRIDGETLAGDYGMLFATPEFKQQAATARAAQKPAAAETSPDFFAVLNRYCCRAAFSPAHTTVDYERLVTIGLNGIIAELEQAQTSADEECREYLAAEIMTLQAVIDWSKRYAALGFAACNRVPAEPPRDFLEAVQSVWLVHTAIGVGERNDASLSLGRIDQYLYPFYRADLDRGVSEAQLAVTLNDLLLKLNRYADAACAVNLGGIDAEGNDLFNDLTRLIVKISTQLQMPSPILAAHIHPGVRQADFDSLTVPELFRIGQPSFYGEFACRQALRSRGVPAADVHKWTVNSCMGLMMPGEEFSDMWALVFTFVLPLELALNHGRPFKGEWPFKLKTVPPDNYANAGEIMDTVMAYAGELLAMLIEHHREINVDEGSNKPDPYVSALLRGGIPGRDRLLGGPRYHTANVDAFALVNAADAITAIEQVVFRQKRYTLETLVSAAVNDFSENEALRRELLAAPKYGNGNVAADKMVNLLAARFAAIVRQCSDDRILYMPSFHTLNGHVGAGKGWGATLDGRMAGEPFAKNIGPMQGRSQNGITGVLSSAAAIDQQFFYGGQALDLHIESGLIDTPADRVKLQAAMQTYFNLGGLLIQVNGADVGIMKKALANPEAYADLTVRIGGYSARFVTLSPDIQREMINRIEHHA